MRPPPEPMLAAAVEEVPPADALPGGCVYEPKWDGFRALAVLDRTVALRSRRGRDLTPYFPDVTRSLRDQLAGPLLLDGELVVWSGNRLDFAALQDRLVAGRRLGDLVAARPASYVAFDLLAAGDDDLVPRPWTERRARLAEVLAGARPPLQLSPATADRDEARRWFDTWDAAGVEGLVVKGHDQPYLPGQRRWLKVRRRRTADAVVGAVAGSLDAPERLVLGAHDGEGVLRIVGSTGPLGGPARRQLAPRLRPPVAPHPWPDVLPASLLGGLPGRFPPRPVTLVEPDVVVEVSVDSAFDRGRWRHAARYVRLRADLQPTDVRVGEHGPDTR